MDISPKFPIISFEEEVILPTTFSEIPSQIVGGWRADSGALTQGKVRIEAFSERILMGDATEPLTGAGIFIGKDESDYEWRVGDPSGNHFHYDGTNLNMVGGIITGGTLQTSSGAGKRIVISSDKLQVYNASDQNTLTLNSATASQDLIEVITLGTSHLFVGLMGNASSGKGIYITDNQGTGESIHITQTGAASAIYISAGANAFHAIEIDSASATRAALDIDQTGDGGGIDIDNQGTGRGLSIKQSTGDAIAAYIEQTRAITALQIRPKSSGIGLEIVQSTDGTGKGLSIVSTTGNSGTDPDLFISSFKNARLIDVVQNYASYGGNPYYYKNFGTGGTMVIQQLKNTNDNPLLHLDGRSNANSAGPILKLSSGADASSIRMVNCSSDPSGGSYSIGDLAVVSGKLKIVTSTGPVVWTVVGTQS